MSENNITKIEKMIYVIRDQKVMLDSDLAELYGVETKALNQAVKRNIKRFPEDFMFRLSENEYDNLKSQIVTSSENWGGKRKQPLVFTENGVAMLSGILNSDRAIEVNISIMRIFTRLRSFLVMEYSLGEKINKLEQGTNKLFKIVFERLDAVEDATPALTPNRKKIGLRIKS
ncbi:MAG: ORF6N domain-containing protein [Bacteriovoracaceae bacterium]